MDRRFFNFNFKSNKRHRLNKFINKWIKSDLPEDQTTVLLLGVTRIPTSPIPPRRPCSLPLESPISPRKTTTAKQRRNSFTTRRHHQLTCKNSSTTSINSNCNNNNNNNNKRRQDNNLNGKWTSGEGVVDVEITGNDTENIIKIDTSGIFVEGGNNKKTAIMDTSIDSIGNCSLDIEASADLSDLSEVSSTGTLRSGASLKTSPADQHLPSYLSLACTVNGYSTTTNYDPERLARSRDVSPHRPQNDNITSRNITSYTIQNNLLSPPNLVPLPILIKPTIKMNDTSKTTFMRKELHTQTTTTTTTIKHNFYGKDTVDACYENGHSNKILTINGETETIKQFHHTETQQTKSIVQQRIERLYGPGALAQSFFAVKRQSNTFNELNKSFDEKNKENIKNSSDNTTSTNGLMKQSNSNPTLPVLKHLRAEFRAQLPISNKTYKCNESTMQKSNTVPILKDDGDNNNKINGHSDKQIQGTVSEGSGIAQTVVDEETGPEKDGHYFLKILQRESDRLLEQADKVELELNEDLPEEIVGKIRSAAGKARLLVSQKMQQFKGLCTNNITQVDGEAFPTTNADLQGFWDMVMLQVDQVDALFKEIADLKANNWQEVVVNDTKRSNGVRGKASSSTTTKKFVNRTTRTPVSAASEEIRKQREARRKEMLEQRRKAMKIKMKPSESVEIFVPESS